MRVRPRQALRNLTLRGSFGVGCRKPNPFPTRMTGFEAELLNQGATPGCGSRSSLCTLLGSRLARSTYRRRTFLSFCRATLGTSWLVRPLHFSSFVPKLHSEALLRSRLTGDFHPQSLRPSLGALGLRNLYLGIDVGRSQDLTVITVFEKRPRNVLRPRHPSPPQYAPARPASPP